MVKVVVKKSLWGAPDKKLAINSQLRSAKTRRMCCLGFCARQAGMKDITDVAFPYEHDEYNKFKAMFPKLTIGTQDDLAEINDSSELSRKEKAKQITALGKKHGVEFVFV